jgi:sporulation protein YlmC with PRC-barrel domain
MLKQTTLASLAAIMLTAGAVAQTGGTGSSTTTAPATSSQASSTAAPMNGRFITEQTTNEYRASKFVGLNVYGADNQKIGDINEILIDGTGSAKAAVIGVGGFLGIGEKNVAVPFASLEWVTAPRPSSTGTSSSGAGAGATGAPAGSVTGTVGSVPAGTVGSTGGTAAPTAGTAPTTAAANRSPEETAATNGYPDHAVLRMTKADLQNAPAFHYYGANKSATGGTATGTGTAPRQ